MNNVHSIVYSVQYTYGSLYRKVGWPRRILTSVYFPPVSVTVECRLTHCTMYNVQFTMYSVLLYTPLTECYIWVSVPHNRRPSQRHTFYFLNSPKKHWSHLSKWKQKLYTSYHPPAVWTAECFNIEHLSFSQFSSEAETLCVIFIRDCLYLYSWNYDV